MDEDLKDALDASLNQTEFEELDDNFVVQAMMEDKDSQSNFDFKSHIQNLIKKANEKLDVS